MSQKTVLGPYNWVDHRFVIERTSAPYPLEICLKLCEKWKFIAILNVCQYILDFFGPLISEFSNLLFILVGGIVDRTFQVGSPPSSSGGSIGSESERIHRQDIPIFCKKETKNLKRGLDQKMA